MTRSPDDTFAVIARLLADDLSLEESIVHRDDLLADLGADSLDCVELVMRIEEEFGVEVPDDVIDDTKTVAAVVSLVDSLISSKETT